MFYRTPDSFLLVKKPRVAQTPEGGGQAVMPQEKHYVVHIDELRLVIRHIGLKPTYVNYVNQQLELGKRGIKTRSYTHTCVPNLKF